MLHGIINKNSIWIDNTLSKKVVLLIKEDMHLNHKSQTPNNTQSYYLVLFNLTTNIAPNKTDKGTSLTGHW